MSTNWSSNHFLHLDKPLLLGILSLSGIGLVILYSAGNQDWDLIIRQLIRLFMGLGVMLVLAQIRPQQVMSWTPWLYLAGLLLLIMVLIIGEISKGSQRWLNFGLFRFQPSEMMKLVVPMMVTWYITGRTLPPNYTRLIIALIIIMVPVMLVVKQPDLGTALLIASSGMFVLFLGGLSWQFILGFIALSSLSAPLLWYFMHDYQRQRIITFLNPEQDPLGSGYHIIQSKIAIGSGGLYGKGWLNGTQSHLEFLPERHTDFIFAVYSEELGLLGILILLGIYIFIISRGLYIAIQAQNTAARLLAGSLTLAFFVYIIINMGMVTGLLPVVGLPLPLISYGGTSLVTLMAGFGLIMAVHTHRRFLLS